MSANDYHLFVPAPGHSNIAGPTPRAHSEARMRSPRAQELFGTWAKLATAPFQGITTDCGVQPGLFSLEPQDAPTPAMVEAVNALLRQVTPAQRSAMCLPVDSELWRHWQNTELYVEHHGLRLDETSAPIQQAVMAVLRASLSGKGYDITRGVMRLNRFLGDLVGGPAVLGEWAYTFCLFGIPSESEPWGWQLFGHHLSLNCFVIGRQMALTPCFLGAEPNYADTGPFAGTRLFEDEERAGLTLMRSLSATQQQQAIVAHAMVGGDLPPGRRHFAVICISAAPFRTIGSCPMRGCARPSYQACNGATSWISLQLMSRRYRQGRSPRGWPKSNGISPTRISAGSADSRRQAHSTIGFRVR